MKYQIITAGCCVELVELVQKMVDQGWRPVGGVSVSSVAERDGYGNTFHSNWYHQSLTLEKA